MKKAINKFPNGSIKFDTRKSVASKIVFPKNDTSAKVLDDSAAGIAAIKTTIPNKSVNAERDIRPFSINAATIISYKLKEDVNVANKNSNKNNAKNTSPNGIWLNAVGSTINSKPGPEAGSKSKANTTGKIANPAKNDTSTVKRTTEPAELGKLTSFFK